MEVDIHWKQPFTPAGLRCRHVFLKVDFRNAFNKCDHSNANSFLVSMAGSIELPLCLAKLRSQ